MKPKIFIDGEHGTTGLQFRSRIAGRNDVDLISIPAEHRKDASARADYLAQADVAVLCLPDDASREAVAMLGGSNATRIIDTSTAYRVHPDWTYGFAEMDPAQRQKIASARLVANPGCYPTGAIGLTRPLVAAGILPADYPVTVNAVSGYTGGGKSLIAQMEDASRDDHIAAPFFAYGLPLQHKHVPEMQVHGLLKKRPLFSPSVGKFPQGMLVQLPLHLSDLHGGASAEGIHAALAAHYAGQAVVQVVPLAESGRLARVEATELAGTDLMRIYVFGAPDTGQVNLIASLDNLGKGASGAALQNMELMLGLS